MGDFEIGTLDGYLNLLSTEFDHDDYLFRGQRREWPLLPALARLTIGADATPTQVEQRLLSDLRRLGVSLIESRPENDFEWMALGQHHGLPTRLLDWTSNPLAPLCQPGVRQVVALFH